MIIDMCMEAYGRERRRSCELLERALAAANPRAVAIAASVDPIGAFERVVYAALASRVNGVKFTEGYATVTFGGGELELLALLSYDAEQATAMVNIVGSCGGGKCKFTYDAGLDVEPVSPGGAPISGVIEVDFRPARWGEGSGCEELRTVRRIVDTPILVPAMLRFAVDPSSVEHCELRFALIGGHLEVRASVTCAGNTYVVGASKLVR